MSKECERWRWMMMKVEDKRMVRSQRSQCLQATFSTTSHTRRHTHAYTQPNQENSTIALKQEHSDAALQSLAGVTMSRKPIKKMINIHVGEASLTCRWDHTPFTYSPTHPHPHTYIYIMGALNIAIQPVVAAMSWEVESRRLIWS